jgi:hypothetical protein
VLAVLGVAFESSTRIWPRGCALTGCHQALGWRPDRGFRQSLCCCPGSPAAITDPNLNHSLNGRAVASVRATQMRVLEVIGILETEGEQSVHSDVPEPHQAQS